MRNLSSLTVVRRALAVTAALTLGAITGTGPVLHAAGVDATNPGFESGMTGWAALAGTNVSVTQTDPHGGQNAAALSRRSGSGAAGLTDSPNQFSGLAAGDICTASAWVKGPAGFKATVKWIALNGTTRVSTRAKTLAFNGGWQQLPQATLTMPSQASTADLHFVAPAFPLGRTWHLDDVTAACGGGSPPPPPPSFGNAGHWLFNEPGSPSTAADASGNGNTGTNFNVQGDGEAYTFNGTDSRVVVPESDTLDPGVADFSFGVTLSMSQPPAVGESFDVLRKGLTTTAGGNYKLEVVHSDGRALARCVVKDANKVVAAIRAAKNLADRARHDVSCHVVGHGVTIVVDGANAGTRTVTTLGSVSNAADVAIGAKAEGTAATGFDWYLGKIYDAWVSKG